jgi:DNA polymerase III alpha subunit
MNVFCDTPTGLEILYRNRGLDNVLFDEKLAAEFNRAALELELPTLNSEPDWSLDFNLPAPYENIDVEDYLRSRAEPGQALDRVNQELEMFKSRNLYQVLKLMIYIVDSMRKNNIVWGVGRGSSVASYCLYLIGTHKIDPIKHNLDITEFLR